MKRRAMLLSTAAGMLLAGVLASAQAQPAGAQPAGAQPAGAQPAGAQPAGALPGGAVAPASAGAQSPQDQAQTATPIKHVVVLFDENVSFDHYFATYPKAANPPGEPAFTAAPNTPGVNNLAAAGLLTNNPNFTNKENGADAAEPFRLDRTQAATADQNHAYTAEEMAYNAGRADLFPKYTGKGTPGGVGAFATKGQVMGYFDGNTVGALWQYAQHFAMSDNSYTDTYGPSTPGALEVVAGQTDGMKIVATTKQPSTVTKVGYYIKDGQGGYTMINDVDPGYDACSVPKDQAMMQGKNIGDLLNAAAISWGGFMGGFDLAVTNANGSTGCQRSTQSAVVGAKVTDYIAHHNWFQYYASTANPTHARPAAMADIGYSVAADGKTRDPANHEYDLNDFYAALGAGNFPAVSYIKLPAYQDGHAGYSDPLDEQAGIARLVNFVEQQPDWKNTAIIIAWDDSDGWYDHAFAKVTSASFDAADQLDGDAKCGTSAALPGLDGKPVNGRCGPGTRLPFLVVSPWAKQNYVSHAQISLASVERFIEDNWLHGERLGGGSFDADAGPINDLFDFTGAGDAKPLFVNPTTGEVLAAAPAGSTAQ